MFCVCSLLVRLPDATALFKFRNGCINYQRFFSACVRLQERQKQLESLGISLQSSGIKVGDDKCFLVNLNADPALNELLVYYLKVRRFSPKMFIMDKHFSKWAGRITSEIIVVITGTSLNCLTPHRTTQRWALQTLRTSSCVGWVFRPSTASLILPQTSPSSSRPTPTHGTESRHYGREWTDGPIVV